MNARWVLAALCVVGVPAGFVACAGEGAPEPPVSDPPNVLTPPDAGDAAEAAVADADALPCADCEYFPETCSATVLCQSGPFVPGSPGGTLDPRTRINVIRGRADNDVWVAGALGALARFDGTSWALSSPGVGMTMHGLWLRDPGEVAVATIDAVYTRGLDAGADASVSSGGWSPSDAPSVPGEYYGGQASLVSTFAAPAAQWMWCASTSGVPLPYRPSGLWRMRRSPDGAFAVALGADSETCRSTHSCTQMRSIHGRSANELWAVGLGGASIRITNADGDTPALKAFNSQTTNALHGVWVAPNGEAWSVGAQGTIRHYRGDGVLWDVVPDVPTKVDLNAVWGTSATDIWAVGDTGVVLHFDGAAWSRIGIAGLGQRRPELTTVWTSTPGQVWIGGQGVLLSLGGNHP